MKQFTVYNESTGQILRTGYCAENDFELQALPGQVVVEGFYPDDQYYFDGTFVEIPPKPGDLYYFDYQTKQWVFDSQQALTLNKGKRNSLLAASDWTQMPDVTIPNKQEWATYRQQLRDMTDQQLIAGDFPIPPQS